MTRRRPPPSPPRHWCRVQRPNCRDYICGTHPPSSLFRAGRWPRAATVRWPDGTVCVAQPIRAQRRYSTGSYMGHYEEDSWIELYVAGTLHGVAVLVPLERLQLEPSTLAYATR
jgi:hypothetical protein